MKITVICANDSMELAFPPDTDAKIIASHQQRISTEMDHKLGVGRVYVHLDEVEYFPGEIATAQEKLEGN